MRPLRALSVLLAGLFALPACIILGRDPPVGSLEVDVAFSNGDATCPAAGVDTLRISFPNGEFSSDTVPCTGQPLPFVADEIPVGRYSIQLDGLSQGTVTWTVTQTVQVGQSYQAVTMTLVPVSAPPSGTVNLIANFLFAAPAGSSSVSAPHLSCAEAGVQSVEVVIDDGAPLVANCHDNASNRDAALVPLAPGSHTFTWTAWSEANGTGTELYADTADTKTVSADGSAELAFNMAGLINGGLQVTWQFGTGAQDCTTAGVSTVTYDLVDASGIDVSQSQTVACSANGFVDPVSPGLSAGVYSLATMKGEDDSGNVLFSTSNVRVYVPADGQAQFTVTLDPVN
jgi:hypothetical protein